MIDPDVAEEVYDRDRRTCLAFRLDGTHRCFGRMTLAHVPELGKNALNKKPPSDKYHLVVECFGANSGGLQPWSEMHRDLERAWLADFYGPPPYSPEAT